jgi:dihydrofolate reductase
MQLTVHEFLTLDGVMQGPGGAEEDQSGGFTRGGWLVPHVDQGFGEIVTSWFTRAEAILLGRNTFMAMRGYWTQVTDPDNPVGVALNGLPKYLVSSTVTEPGWGETTVLSGDPIEEVRRLKERPGGELQVHGSWQLASALHAAGLVDEYRLLTFPVTVGTGKRLFTEDAPASGFRLIESRTTGTGVTYASFAPSEFTSGVVAVDEGKEVV